ncbi:MAG: hypothetical protein WD749_03330 [Phycisphaerales bacterium]
MATAGQAKPSPGPVGATLPAGYRALPLNPAERGSVAACVVIREQAHPVHGRLIQLRSAFDRRVILGCLLDRAAQVLRWTEVHIQDVAGLAAATPVYREAASNLLLDERWREAARAMRAAAQGADAAVIATEWESSHPPPVALDIGKGVPVAAADDQGRAWQLLRDESVLTAKGLASYGGSAHRYLYVPDAGPGSPIRPVTTDAPGGSSAPAAAPLFPTDMVPLNPGAGLLMICPRAPVSLEAMIDFLSDDPAGAALRISPFPETETSAGAQLKSLGEEGFISSRQSRWARAIEVLHLKLRLLADAVGAVRGVVERTGRPFLNITADSFRVEIGAPGEGLPLLWTARGVLVAPGDAAALPLPGAEEEYYIRPSEATSVYLPDSSGRAVQGRGSLRIRKVEAAGAHGAVLITGTLTTQERIRPNPSDLTWLRIHAGNERVDLYARLEADPAAAAGEYRFRTVPQKVSDAAKKGLQAAEGVPISDAPFQVIPLLSTPCDLYSLGVLAVRTLLVGAGNTLPVALDELFSLGRNAATEGEGEPAARILAVLKSDPRWGEALGPQRVAHGLGSVSEALDAVPLELWCEVLSVVVRLFPGLGPGAFCRDLGDAPPAGLHAVFDGALAELRGLIRRTRSLVVVDWSANREVHSVIRARRAGTAPAPRPRQNVKV